MARKLLSKWTEIDPKQGLSAKSLSAYEAYKALYAKAAEARKAFETQLQADAKTGKVTTEGQELAISYNFGKLSLAIAEADKPSTGAGKKAITSLQALTA